MSRFNQGWCHCPECKKWVPEDLMNRDYDDDGKLIRVCTPCLEGTSSENNYVYDPNFGKTQCVYCLSYNTTCVSDDSRKYTCNDCGANFRRM